jgi:hypothetical protein
MPAERWPLAVHETRFGRSTVHPNMNEREPNERWPVPRRQPDRACDRQGRLTSSFTHALSYVSVSTRHVVVLEALLLWSTTRVLVFATILCLSIPRASQFSRPVLLQSHILLFANALLDASSRFLPTIPTVLPASMSVVRPVKYDDS